MHLQLEIPDDILRSLVTSDDQAPRAALEAVALEGYRTRRLSEYQLQRMLGFEHGLQVHAFLKANKTPLNYSIEDLDHDMKTLEDLRKQFTLNK